MMIIIKHLYCDKRLDFTINVNSLCNSLVLIKADISRMIFFRAFADQSSIMTAKNAEAAPVCCRSNSFVLVCECFSCSRSSSMQQAVVLLIWRAEKDEKGPESWGARVKSSGCHDWDILHNAARSKNGKLEPGILIGNSYTWPWANKSKVLKFVHRD